MEDTIVALSTPLGSGGISIVRMSGKDSLKIAKVFSHLPTKINPRELYLCDIKQDGLFEKCLIVFFKNPNSFTGEDILEFQCHGGIFVCNKIIDLCVKNGARLAEPGEFTKRAFLNGKLSLEQAEGVVDIINSQTQAEVKAGYSLLNGELFKKVQEVKKHLTEMLAQIEVSLDYPEHDIEYETVNNIEKRLITIKQTLQEIVDTEQTGKIVKNGINVVILGKPNVGKSSLMNRLLKYDRAIVTDVAGTTRDTLIESFVYKNIKINLTDTAGIHESQDKVEKIGIDKAKEAINEADVILLILDGSKELSKEDRDNISLVKGKKVIYVQNKSDLADNIRMPDAVKISALQNKGIDELKEKIYNLIINKKIISQDIILTNQRHVQAIKDAILNIENALQNIHNISLDCISIDIKQAWINLGKITGETTDEEIIDLIFSKFCLGK